MVGFRHDMLTPPERSGNVTRKPQPPLLGGLISRRLRVRAREVVFIKGVIEASEGLAAVFAESGGDLTVATSASQQNELDRILQDLANETGAVLEERGS
jgi:hypothetical protein